MLQKMLSTTFCCVVVAGPCSFKKGVASESVVHSRRRPHPELKFKEIISKGNHNHISGELFSDRKLHGVGKENGGVSVVGLTQGKGNTSCRNVLSCLVPAVGGAMSSVEKAKS